LLKNIIIRLGSRLKQGISKCVLMSFGDVDIYLFGSRVDDSKKGGDIDLAIDIAVSKEQFRQYKIQFITALIRMDLDLKIDVVPYHTGDELLREEIDKTAVKIN